jgi:hypothetical protein
MYLDGTTGLVEEEDDDDVEFDDDDDDDVDVCAFVDAAVTVKTRSGTCILWNRPVVSRSLIRSSSSSCNTASATRDDNVVEFSIFKLSNAFGSNSMR